VPSDPPALSRPQLALAAAVVAAVLTPLALTATYHCDELNAIRHAALFAEGDFQVPGRPGLLWFALTPLFALPSPPTILVAGRLLSVAATALLAVLWLRLAGREIGRAGALAGLALLVASPNYMAHAFEIRTDTFVLPLQLLLLGLLCRRAPPRWAGWAAGVGVAAALLISQKSVYFVAGLHGAALVYGLVTVGRPALWPTIRRLLVMDLLGLALVLGYYGLLIGLNEDPGAFLDEHLGAAASTAFDPYPLDRKARGLWHASWEAPLLYLTAVVGIALALHSPRRRPLLATLAVLDLTLLSTIFFHRGFFHYYVASMEPIHALLAALTLSLLWQARGRPGPRGAVLNVALALVITGSLIWGGVRWDRFRQVHKGYQEAVMDTVTGAFADKVQVFDGIGLLPGYPQPGFFMTKGGRDAYRDRHPKNGLVRLWTEPPAQVYVYDYMTRSRYLTAVERRWVLDHYAPYRDNVRLLGYRGRVGSKGQDDEGRTIEILVPGPYTAWFHGGWTADVRLAGASLGHGQTVDLAEGDLPLVIDGRSGSGELWLLIGRDREPDEDAVDYSMFPILNRKRYQHYKSAGDLATPPDCPSIN
jgi:hypothetical protein